MKRYLHLPFVLLLVMMTGRSLAQVPPLGATAGFAAFTAVGALSNAGPSSFTGDIGTDAGLLSGFPPGTLTGTLHVADAVTAQAATDVNTAYTALAGMSCVVVLGTTLGSGQTLTPDVYCISGAAALNGDLVLDAGGDTNALFIIQIDGALSTSTFSNVVLTNSASPCNVYWQVNGAFDLGDGSSFMGNLFANGAINLLDGATFTGHMLTRQGAITLTNNTGDICIPEIVVFPSPLTLTSAGICAGGGCVYLEWETAADAVGSDFLVQRSSDPSSFVTVATQSPTGGNQSPTQFSFTDESPAGGINYYRIGQRQANGEMEYTGVKAVLFSRQAKAVSVFPNPFTSELNILLSLPFAETGATLSLVDFTGKEIASVPLKEEITHLSSLNIAPGIYLYRVIAGYHIIQTGKLVSAR